MDKIEDHLTRVLALSTRRVSTAVPLDQAQGLVLAKHAIARFPVPAFDNAAVDGFAVHTHDLQGDGPWTLPVAGDIPAGAPAVTCPSGTAVRIMTGAPLPTQDDLRVIPVESTNIPRGPFPLPDFVTINAYDAGRLHIRHTGENLAAGHVVAQTGTRIDAGTLAALVSTGVADVDVYAPPRVTVVSTGDELVQWPHPIGKAQIPDSNLPMVAALLRQHTNASVTMLHASDVNEDAATLLENAAEASDIVITTGGVSAGAYDVVRALTEGSPQMWFGHVAQRPGAPQGAGRWHGATFVCLPGNPVAAFVSCVLYALPLVRSCGGLATATSLCHHPWLTASVAEDFPTPRHEQTVLVPVRLMFSANGVRAVPFAGNATSSSFVASLPEVDGIAVLSPGAAQPVREVRVLLFGLDSSS